MNRLFYVCFVTYIIFKKCRKDVLTSARRISVIILIGCFTVERFNYKNYVSKIVTLSMETPTLLGKLVYPGG